MAALTESMKNFQLNMQVCTAEEAILPLKSQSLLRLTKKFQFWQSTGTVIQGRAI